MENKCLNVIKKAFDGNSRILFIGSCGKDGKVRYEAVAGQKDYSFGQSASPIDASTKLGDATNAEDVMNSITGGELLERHYTNAKTQLPGNVETTVSASGVIIAGAKSSHVLRTAMNNKQLLFFEERDFELNQTRSFIGFLESLNETAGADTQTYDLSAKAASDVTFKGSFYGETPAHPYITVKEDALFEELLVGDTFDENRGVAAYDVLTGKSLTSAITFDKTAVDVNTPGTYQLHFQISNGGTGNSELTTSGYRTIQVFAKPKVETQSQQRMLGDDVLGVDETVVPVNDLTIDSTAKEMEDYAAENGIDLTGANTKQEKLDKINGK